MKTIIKRPHFFFFGLIPFVVLIGLLYSDAIIDLTISNEYFSLNVNYWCIFCAVFVGLFGINYATLKWIRKQPRKDLTLLHVVLQTLAILLFLLFLTNINPKNNIIEKLFPHTLNYYAILNNSFFLFGASVFINMINFFQCLFLITHE